MNNIDQIDAYLDGTLSPEEKTAFENQLANDESLRQQLEVQKNLRAGIDRLGMKAATAATFRKMTLKNKIYKWGVATITVATIATTTYFIMNNSSSSPNEGPEITYELPATNEEGGTNWADADRNLPTQLFHIDPYKDTVIETMGGMIFAIPAGAFLDAKDPVTLEIREALTPMDIMKGGLSTTSNGELLETGGMFYLNARNGETSLKINPAKPVYANVPTNEIRPNMQLFDGERKDDGSINWVNPKPMEKQLIPVDIFSLNFYPNGFLTKVAELGFDANDRKVTDSIYYSYAGRQQTQSTGGEISSDSARVRHIMLSYKGAAGTPNDSRTKSQALSLANDLKSRIELGEPMEKLVLQYTDDPGSKSGNMGDYGWYTRESGFVEPFKNAGFNNSIGDVVIVETDFGYHVIQVLDKTSPTRKVHYGAGVKSSPDGEALFKANCASCHTTTDQRIMGAGLNGVLGRIPGGNWKYDYVRNPSGMVTSGDAYANKLYQESKGVMSAFPMLTNEEIDVILAYADHGGKPYGMEIDPARIAAIKTEEFQNTIIATKEFELRMRIVFAKCEPRILDLYVNNLDKKMYEIDSIVASMTWGDPSINADFRYLMSMRHGGVAITLTHMKELQEYYVKKQEAVRMASEKMRASRTAEQQKQDSIYYEQRYEQEVAGREQYQKNVTDEFEINITEAYRQLGLPKYLPPPADAYYSVNVQSVGWKNIDAYVMESTINRTTIDYTDPDSGKKAVIKYEELKINVDASAYSQIMVYLVSDKLPCFQRVSQVNGVYSEKMNELMEYSLVVIAEKDGVWFSSNTPKVTPGTVNVTLQSTDENSLRNSLNSLYAGKVGADFSAEITYMDATHKFNVRKEKEAEQMKIDQEIMDVIFPCAYDAFRHPELFPMGGGVSHE